MGPAACFCVGLDFRMSVLFSALPFSNALYEPDLAMSYMLSANAKLVRMRNGHSRIGPIGQSLLWAVSPILSEEVFRDVLTAPNSVPSN